MGCLAVNIKRFKRKSTWQILDEVDELMKHVPSWVPFSWSEVHKKDVGSFFQGKKKWKKNG